MKRFQNLLVYLAVLALSGAVTVKSVEPSKVEGVATVRSVKGAASYTLNGAAPQQLKPGIVLPAGAAITTGPDSEVYVSVNGVSSAVRIQAETTLAIPEMSKIGAGREADTETQLDLRAGSILGQVKKVSANSSYEIKTPHGVAGIRGTDFSISVTSLGNGQYSVTFTSVTGQVIVSAVVSGLIQTRTLHDGESWTPGNGDVHAEPVGLLQAYSAQINAMITEISIQPIGTIITAPAQVLPPFNNGNQPGQNPPSGG